jgi:hypothetical protein
MSNNDKAATGAQHVSGDLGDLVVESHPPAGPSQNLVRRMNIVIARD